MTTMTFPIPELVILFFWVKRNPEIILGIILAIWLTKMRMR